MRFAIFPLHLSKVLRLPRKSDAMSYEVLNLSRRIISANLKLWCSKMQPLSGNQRPDLPTSLTNMSLVLRLPREIHLWRSSSNVPLAPATQNNASTSKSGANMWCLVHFDLEMCFAPHRRTLFEHLNFQKCSEAEVFCTFWLGNVLQATTACTFSTSQLPKVLRAWCALCMLTSKCPSRHKGVHFFNISTSKSGPRTVCFVHFAFEICASRHKGVHFFISHLASWLRTRRFSEPTFRPSGATHHWKNTVFSRLSYLFAHLDLLSSETFSFVIFFLLPFSSLTLPISAFHLPILAEVWLLYFLRWLYMYVSI